MIPALFANSIAADAGLIPGLAIFGPAMGLPVSVLAAFIERPFVTRAGFGKSAIWFSLQANFISLLVGYVATMVVIPFVMGPSSAFALAWPFVAVGISAVTERQYLNARLSPTIVPWTPIVVANIISALLCVTVLLVTEFVRGRNPYLEFQLRPYEMPTTVAVVASSLALFFGSFFVPAPSAGTQRRTERCDAADSR